MRKDRVQGEVSVVTVYCFQKGVGYIDRAKALFYFHGMQFFTRMDTQV